MKSLCMNIDKIYYCVKIDRLIYIILITFNNFTQSRIKINSHYYSAVLWNKWKVARELVFRGKRDKSKYVKYTCLDKLFRKKINIKNINFLHVLYNINNIMYNNNLNVEVMLNNSIQNLLPITILGIKIGTNGYLFIKVRCFYISFHVYSNLLLWKTFTFVESVFLLSFPIQKILKIYYRYITT